MPNNNNNNPSANNKLRANTNPRSSSSNTNPRNYSSNNNRPAAQQDSKDGLVATSQIPSNSRRSQQLLLWSSSSELCGTPLLSPHPFFVSPFNNTCRWARPSTLDKKPLITQHTLLSNEPHMKRKTIQHNNNNLHDYAFSFGPVQFTKRESDTTECPATSARRPMVPPKMQRR